MSSKTNQTPDGEHVQFGDVDSCSNPPGFDLPGDLGAFESGYSGRIMVNPGDAGFGGAMIQPDED